jgi:hypothetical protein
MILRARFPFKLLWGPEFIQIYNDPGDSRIAVCYRKYGIVTPLPHTKEARLGQ